ncbi:MAG: PhoX family phosphatase [Casimicrobium sp.]
MAKDFTTMEHSNASTNSSIHDVSYPSRRIILKGGLSAAIAGLFAPIGVASLAGCATTGGASSGSVLGFKSVPLNTLDTVTVPEGYRAQVLYRWGDAVGIAGQMPTYKPDASNSAAEQALQAGMHHDGIHYFPLDGNRRGLLAMNHEYTDDGLLHVGGMQNWSAEKVAKAQAAMGVSVIEVVAGAKGWEVVRPSRYARRITATTPMMITGPARGHAMMRTRDDASGAVVLGTINNCAHGYTPWGTYLTCEENFNGYFNGPDKPDATQARWGLKKSGAGYRWHEHDERFDVAKHPNEYNRFGWVVEIDPADPDSTPIKRTALGRAAHEGACVTQTKDKRVVVYMGEDARFEYIYKFVSRDAVRSGGAKANADLLDHGTLFVARFAADGRGQWVELSQGRNGLGAEQGFATQGDVVIKARQASDLVGATKMDRPEWITADPNSGWVYCTLTNNSNRGKPGFLGVDAANPRADNTMGNIIRWKEDGDFDGRSFSWNHFVMAGDPTLTRADAKGNVRGDSFGSPDGLWCDTRGVLWVQTDISTSVLGKGDYQGMSNNMMLAADVATGEMRRFLVGPRGCEITGCIATPDLRTMFINIQHPGETASERSNPDAPSIISSWPDQARPRSATVVITKLDGGVIGT